MVHELLGIQNLACTLILSYTCTYTCRCNMGIEDQVIIHTYNYVYRAYIFFDLIYIIYRAFIIYIYIFRDLIYIYTCI